MRTLLARARWWQWGLLHAGWFTLVMLGATSLVDGGPTAALVAGSLAGGVVVGATMGPLSAWIVRWSRDWTAHLPHLPDLPGSGRRAAERAAHRGPVPDDPIVHRVALGIARSELRLATRLRWVATVVFGANAALQAVLVVQSPQRWPAWLLAPAFAALTVRQWTQPGRLRRRIILLETQDPSPAPSGR